MLDHANIFPTVLILVAAFAVLAVAAALFGRGW